MMTALQIQAEAHRRLRLRQHGTQPAVWTPQPGPQALAYLCPADVIGYGGAAGGGKSDLLLGIAGMQHRRSIIFRRVFPSLRGLIERSREVFNSEARSHLKDSFNESLHIWRLDDGRMVEFGAIQYDDDRKKHMGQPRDFMGFDEATEFPERIVRFLMGWNRTTTPEQRCKAVLTFNPPMDESGSWVTRFFGPWLDEAHANPALDGELRYYAMVDGEEIECTPESFEHKGEVITPRSRTFFHANLADNPILAATGYGATINAMPEPLRSLLKGNFNAAHIADPWQVIPVAWVKAAQARWTAHPLDPNLAGLTGCDVARGGKDKTVIASFIGPWLAPLQKYPGASTPDGPTVAGLLAPAIANEHCISIDVIGVGSSGYDILRSLGIPVLGVNFAEAAPAYARDKSGKFKFRNLRAYAYWSFREALDPDTGENLALPPDPELLADLCSPKWSLSVGGILIEPKEDISERIGRSPDCGDAVVLAYYGGRRGMSNSAVGAFA